MLGLTAIFGTRNERILKKFKKRVATINAMEAKLMALPDEALTEQMNILKARCQQGESLDTLLETTFAVVREASRRVLGMRHYDEQLLCGMVLHSGKIAEMATGEGKTLSATLPACLNALTGRGVHVVTVNDYLARRDAQWMSPVYQMLGLTVGVNIPNLSPEEKQQAYQADITYGTNSEFGFDYLRDNMATHKDECVRQKPLNFAIIDEVDSILIDEARTPLIISGRLEDSSRLYTAINQLAIQLEIQERESTPENPVPDTGDFTLDKKSRQVHLTERGQARAEALLVEAGLIGENEDLYSAQNIIYLHHLNAALRAHHLYHKDIDYIISPQGEIVIVDEHTGRTMEGRRWSEGLHQAVEAKEKVEIQNENQTLASITYQNFFKQYAKISGMTGTADTEAQEFQEIYGLEVIVLPTHKPCQRDDSPDLIYQKASDKYKAMIEDIKKRREKQQPVLVGTTSIENSEILSALLKKAGIPHQVLNAKYHEREAQIIMDAGKPGTVTIATNMAGRGTDIVLGGSLEAEWIRLGDAATPEQKAEAKAEWQKRHDAVVAAGGLHVMGSERHESRRVDNQLRGRCARQGDPGSSQFYLSLEDPLLRIFASEWVAQFLQKLGLENEENLESRMLTRSIQKAQRRVEAYHFDIRKQLLEFDNVINEQRMNIYALRDTLMGSEDLSAYFAELTAEVLEDCIKRALPENQMESEWDVEGLTRELAGDFDLHCPVADWVQDKSILPEEIVQRVQQAAQEKMQAKEAALGAEMMRKYEKAILLQILDSQWREHLAAIDYIRQNIGLRGFAQKDPRQEFKRECFDMFMTLLWDYKRDAVRAHFRFRAVSENDLEVLEARRRAVLEQMQVLHPGSESSAKESDRAPTRAAPKLGRNEACFCGSGQKYKHCHGVLKDA